MFRRSLLASAIATGLLPASRAWAEALEATGAGSSFPNATIQKWIEMAQSAAGVSIKFDPIGSGGGQNKIMAGDTDFGVSEMPMPDEMKANANLIQFPISVGGVVCVANVPGLAANQLKLNGVLIAAIFSGQIKTWNDPRIAEINAGVTLPEMDTKPVYQRDLIGTTFVFTQYILAANADWREKFGPRITRRWAVGSNVDGNIFMGDTIKTVPGSIGYMDYNTAVKNNYPTVSLLNAAGKYVAPNPANFAAAAAAADWANAPAIVVSLINQAGDNSWPITTPSYVQVPLEPKDPARSQAVRKFFEFALTKGGSAATENNLIPLPEPAVKASLAIWDKVKATN